MKRFAALLDRLAYEPSRNNKLRLMTDYFATTEDPERGWALAALTGALAFAHAKPGLIRALISERTDPVLFALSHDYVGDLSETVALMWPTRDGPVSKHQDLKLGAIIAALSTLGKAELPAALARWLDQLDETGRWALLKLVTAELRIGVSARLGKTAVAALGGKDPQEIELMWSSLQPPYAELFAWLEGRADKPASSDPAPFRPPMLAHAIEESELAALDPKDFIAEWKWDGIRVQAAAGRDAKGGVVARLYSRTGDDISRSFPDLVSALRTPGVIDGELLIMRERRVQSFNVLQQRLNRKSVDAKLLAQYPAHLRAYDLLLDGRERPPRPPLCGTPQRAGSIRRAGPRSRASTSLRRFRSRPGTSLPPRAPIRPRRVRARMPRRLKASCSSAATRPTCRAARRSVVEMERDPLSWTRCSRTRSAATASARPIIQITPSGSGAAARRATCWCRVGKAYFGFTDEELLQIDRFVRRNTVERFGPVREVVHGADQGLVLELAFEGLQRSNRHRSGIAMRFPRINRLRWDKPPGEADRLGTLSKPCLEDRDRARQGSDNNPRRDRITTGRIFVGARHASPATTRARQCLAPTDTEPDRHNDHALRPAEHREHPAQDRQPQSGEPIFGGPPLSVIFRLVRLSILIGVILEVMGLDPWNILDSLRRLLMRVWDMGFDAIRWLSALPSSWRQHRPAGLADHASRSDGDRGR